MTRQTTVTDDEIDAMLAGKLNRGSSSAIQLNNGSTQAQSDYATSGHTHSDYASSSHSHSGYASSSHKHDSDYVKGNHSITKSNGNFYIS